MRRPIHLPGAALLAALLAPAHAALSPTEIFAKVSPSIWRVQTYDADGVPLGQGSAVVVAPDTLVTNCHVLKGAARVTVRHEQTRAEARLAMWDTERDVCRVVTTGLKAPAVSLRLSGMLLVGQPVYALGNPEGLDLTMSSGLLSSIRRNERGQVVLLQTSAAISGGSSGGGLFDDGGALIGLTTLGSARGDIQNINFAVPADWIAELPERHAKLHPDKPVVGPGATTPAGTAPASPPVASRRDPRVPPAGLGGDFQRGDEFEYTVTDRYTGNARRVVYRVDRIDGDKVVFNDGARIESRGGQLLDLTTPMAGDMDTMAPPGGWAADPLANGLDWRLNYKGRDPSVEHEYELTGVVRESSVLRTEAGEFEAVHVLYTGWTRVRGVQMQVEVDVWVAPALRRVVRFRSEVRSRGGPYANLRSREQTELTAIRRAER